jgi:hypothetical protein
MNQRALSFLLMKKTSDTIGDLDGWMQLVLNPSTMKALSSFCLSGEIW